MRNDKIKEGDLVMVVRGSPCCGSMGGVSYGITFTAGRVAVFNKGFSRMVCKDCGAPWTSDLWVTYRDRTAYPLFMLKKFDPPAEEETRTEMKEEVAQ